MNNQQTFISERTLAENKVNSARHNLLLMIGLTVVNLIMLALGSYSMMLFSATVPYFSVLLGIEFGFDALLTAGIVFAVLILLVYLLCWFLSKKHYAWMVVAFVLFAIDTICLILIYVSIQDVSGILDLIIHVVVLYNLFTGVKYGRKLKLLPEETPTAEENIAQS